jgi:isoquinoline 1-oxidoreductase subunit alpha
MADYGIEPEAGMIQLNVNGQQRSVGDDVEGDTPLLWVLRDHLGLVGAKYGCGIGACGACTVHVDGKAVRSCTLPVSQLAGKKITTIEGLAQNGKLHPLQQAWIDADVPQCGYCQAGKIMNAAALLNDKPKPSEADIHAAMTGNMCRCACYTRIRTAIQTAANPEETHRG